MSRGLRDAASRNRANKRKTRYKPDGAFGRGLHEIFDPKSLELSGL